MAETKNYKRVKLGCYATNLTMSVISNLSPVLFITFRSLYGISYTLLGLLVLVNFCTQLSVDLVFSFFSHKFNIPKTVKFTPVIAIVGFAIYSVVPYFVAESYVYLILVIGTVIFSAASGLAEVLISPVVAAIPAENPEREMSKLHSVYAWGVVGVVLYATLFLLGFGGKHWQLLSLSLVLIPLSATVFYFKAELPPLETPERVSGALAFLKKKGLWVCVLAIFLGGASECTMAQWASGYIERSLGISKLWGDVFGVALFAVMLGLGRTMYAKIGKNISKVLFLSAIGATACYLVAAVSNVAVIGLIACGLTGFCVAMMWPGCLIVAADFFPKGGVFIYAMMAAGGDLGASIGPQLVGVVTDGVMGSSFGAELATKLGITVEQLGMKCGMLVGTLFPFIAVFVFFALTRHYKKRSRALYEN